MPTTRRRRRHARMHGRIVEGSTRWNILLHGDELLADDPGFQSESEERAAWLRLRSELMARCGPGERPSGFYKWELNIGRIVWYWDDQLSTLLAHGLITEDEASRCETVHSILSPTQKTTLYQHFENRDDIVLAQLGIEGLCDILGEFKLAVRWHAWRGRPELAQRYQLRTGVMQSLLREAGHAA